VKVNIKKGDQVMVIAGNSKGKTGEVMQVFTASSRVIVSGLNMVKKHTKATQDEEGGIKDVEAAIHISNVALVDPKSGEATRIGRKEVDGKSTRYSKKSGEIIK
jgi:large subunit ribosomal protein L24